MGLCYAYGSPEKAMKEFDRALEYSQTNEEKAMMDARYARFLRSNNMYQEAIDCLEEAVALSPNECTLKFELITSLCWVNSFDKARSIFATIEVKQLSDAMQHEYAMRYADMKRREADVIAQSNASLAFEYLKDAFFTLENDATSDKRKFDLMANILCAIGYLYIDSEVIDYIIAKLNIYYTHMRTTRKYKRFKEVMAGKLSIIPYEKRRTLSRYLLDSNVIISKVGKNQGVVIVLKENYGLFRIPNYEQSVYFSLKDAENCFHVGDIISYEKITPGAKGLIATNVKHIGDIYSEL